MQIITSKDNAIIKLAGKLLTKKYRDEYGMFLVEGKRGVADIFSSKPGLVQQIIVADYADFPGATISVPGALFAKLCETETAQGVLAIVKKPLALNFDGWSLLLDRVRDPGNVGTLIRTAAAVGFNNVFLKDCADAYSGKVVRSSMSASVKVNIFEKPPDILTIKRSGKSIICADMNGRDAYSFKPQGDICLVIGSEANGISGEIADYADEIIALPMNGNIESLNAAVCGSILMYNFKYLK